VFQFLYEYPGTLNQQSSDLFMALLQIVGGDKLIIPFC